MAPSCKIELARFSAWLRIQDGTECGKMKLKSNKKFDEMKLESKKKLVEMKLETNKSMESLQKQIKTLDLDLMLGPS